MNRLEDSTIGLYPPPPFPEELIEHQRKLNEITEAVAGAIEFDMRHRSKVSRTAEAEERKVSMDDGTVPVDTQTPGQTAPPTDTAASAEPETQAEPVNQQPPPPPSAYVEATLRCAECKTVLDAQAHWPEEGHYLHPDNGCVFSGEKFAYPVARLEPVD